MSTKIGIYGYGNLAKGVECAIKQNADMELVAVFTRRDPKTVTILTETAKVCHVDEAKDYQALEEQFCAEVQLMKEDEKNKNKELTTPEAKKAFVSSFDWNKITEQDEEVWAEIYNALK